jgi:hypothetical protein
MRWIILRISRIGDRRYSCCDIDACQGHGEEKEGNLVENGVPIMRAANHVNQRSFYFADPDGNVLEIYYEMPYALELFSNGRSDEDEALPVSGPGEPLPQWLLEEWPAPEMKSRIGHLRRQKERTMA